jgi:hypothetical protein
LARRNFRLRAKSQTKFSVYLFYYVVLRRDAEAPTGDFDRVRKAAPNHGNRNVRNEASFPYLGPRARFQPFGAVSPAAPRFAKQPFLETTDSESVTGHLRPLVGVFGFGCSVFLKQKGAGCVALTSLAASCSDPLMERGA